MSEGIAVGPPIVVNLILNTDGLQKSLAEANKKLASISDTMEKEFKKAGGAIGAFGERIGNVGKNIKKMFGDDAPAVMQKFGRDIEKAIGASESQVKGLGQAVESLEGAFKLVGLVVSTLTLPILAVGGAVIGVVTAVETLRDGLANGFGAAHAIIAALNAPLVLMSAPILIAVQAVRALKAVWAEVGDSVTSVWGTIRDFGSGVVTSIVNALNKIVAAISNQIANAIELVAKGYQWVEDNTGISTGAGARTMATAQSIRSGGANISTTIGDAWTAAKDKVADAASGVKSGFGSIVDTVKADFKEIAGAIFGMLTPGSKPGKAAAAKEGKTEDAMKGLEAARKAALEYEERRMKENTEALKAHDEETAEINNKLAESMKADAEAQKAQQEEISRAKQEEFEAAMETVRKNKENLAKEQQARAEQWRALASGNFGTAAGVGGLGGAALNIIGQGAVGQSRYLGGALSGAAQGGEVGGGWGAIIGALIGLVTQSKEFGKAMHSLDVILESVVNALGKGHDIVNDFFDELQGLSGLFDMIGGLLSVLSQFDMGMQGLKAILSWLSTIDFSGATKWLDDAGRDIDNEIGYWFDMRGQTKDQYLERKKEEDRVRKEQEFNSDLQKLRTGGMDGFAASLRTARMDSMLLGDAEYQAAAKTVQFSQTLNDLGQSTIKAQNSLEFLSDPKNYPAIYEEYEAQRDLERARQAQLEQMEDRYNLENGLADATERATDSLTKFSDSLINAAPGYKLAQTQFSTSLAGPGFGTTSSLSAGGGGGGGGGAPLSAGTVNVYVGNEQVSAIVAKQGERDAMLGYVSGLGGGVL